MPRPVRPVTPVDVVAAALSRIVPRAAGSLLDQARLDAHSVSAGLSGARERPFSSRREPASRAPSLAEVDPVFHVLPRALRASYSLLRSDLSMIARELRGERAPAVVPRPKRAPVAMEVRPRPLHVVAVTRETADAISVELVEMSGAPVAFTPGQFLTLHVTIDGRTHKRAYSLSRAPEDGAAITIKRIEGGLVSGFLHATLKAGDTLTVLGPSGSFVAGTADVPRHLVCFAGGSGITPIASIAEHVLRTEPGARVTLLYGNRGKADVIFDGRLRGLVAAYPGRFTLELALEEGGVLRGRLDEPMLETLFERHALETRLSGERAPEYFICGPQPMMDAVERVLAKRSVARERIHIERFQSPGSAPSRALPTTAVPVRIRKKGVEVEVQVAPGKTLLEAALAAGETLPFSCAMGGCAACKCTIVSGQIAHDEPNCLSDAERRAGQTLTCVGHPVGPATIEVP